MKESPNEFIVCELDNGITIVAEPMPDAASVSVSLLMPFGVVDDCKDRVGESSLLVEMLAKGAGEYSSKEFSDEFDRYGIHHSQSGGLETSRISASMLPEHLPKALELISLMIKQPRLARDELEPVRALALQELLALEDDPASKTMVELNKEFFPEPFGRSAMGTSEGLKSVSIETIQGMFRESVVASGSVIGIAGSFDPAKLVALIEQYFGQLSGGKQRLEVPEFAQGNSYKHIEIDSSQTQIALAYPMVSLEDPLYYAAQVGTNILSGAMCGRLFVEVREKRGLVYRVSASHSGAVKRGALFAYAGTTDANAQETVDVMLGQLRLISQGVERDELDRAKADLRSRLIMKRELASHRAAALVGDWWNFKRLRTLEEIDSSLRDIGDEQIRECFSKWPVDNITLVTLGKRRIEAFS